MSQIVERRGMDSLFDEFLDRAWAASGWGHLAPRGSHDMLAQMSPFTASSARCDLVEVRVCVRVSPPPTASRG